MYHLVLACLSKESLTNTQEILASLTIGTPNLGISKRLPLFTYGYLKLPDRIHSEGNEFNPFALELDIYSLAHHLCKMLIFYEPRRLTLGNTRHFVKE